MNIRNIIRLLPFFVFHSVGVAEQKVGQTYEVLEIDPVAVIKVKAAEFDYEDYQKSKVQRSIDALRYKSLPRTVKPGISFHTVEHTVEREVTDGNGTVIYPVGYKYNALDYLKWSFTVFVLDDRDIEIYASEIKPNDIVLLNNGKIFEAQEKLRMPVYVIDAKTKKALKVKSVPTVISQVGNKLKVEAQYHE